MLKSDKNYVHYKLEVLRNHAKKLLTHHANVTDEDFNKLSEREKEVIEDR